MASIGPGGRHGKIMNLELELADDDSQDDSQTPRDRGSAVHMQGKKLAQAPPKPKPRHKKTHPPHPDHPAPNPSKKSPKPPAQRTALDSLFKHNASRPEPALPDLALDRLPPRQHLATTASSQADWTAFRLAEDDTCHTNLHEPQTLNKESSTSMLQEVLSSKPSPRLGMPMIVEVSIADSAAGAEDRTAALLSELLEDLANKLSQSRTDKHSRSAALQQLSEFVYKCENTEIDADVITSTKLGRYLQLMYLMLLEFSSADSPQYDQLIPRTSKLIGKYKRIVTEQVAPPYQFKQGAKPSPFLHQPAFNLPDLTSVKSSNPGSVSAKLEFLLSAPARPVGAANEAADLSLISLIEASSKDPDQQPPVVMVKEEEGSMLDNLRKKVIRKIFQRLRDDLHVAPADARDVSMKIERCANRIFPSIGFATKYIAVIRDFLKKVIVAAPHAERRHLEVGARQTLAALPPRQLR